MDIEQPILRLRALLEESTRSLSGFGRRAKPLPPFKDVGHPLLAKLAHFRVAPMERFVSEKEYDNLVTRLSDMQEQVRLIAAAVLDSEDDEDDTEPPEDVA